MMAISSAVSVLPLQLSAIAARTRAIGTCVLCDESLEYRLSHERVVELHCGGGHVAHGECFAATGDPEVKCVVCATSPNKPVERRREFKKQLQLHSPTPPLPPPPPPPLRPPSPPQTRIPEPKLSITPASQTALRFQTVEQCISCLLQVQIPRPVTLPPSSVGAMGTSRSNALRDSLSADAALRKLAAQLDRSCKLDLAKLGRLRAWGKLGLASSSNRVEQLSCFLFVDHLLCLTECTETSDKLVVHTSLCISKYLTGLVCAKPVASSFVLILTLSRVDMPQLRLIFSEEIERETWRAAMLQAKPALVKSRSSDSLVSLLTSVAPLYIPLSIPAPSKPSSLKLTEISSLEKNISPALLPHISIDVVVALPLWHSGDRDAKIKNIENIINFLLDSIGVNDRLGVVIYSYASAFSLTPAGPKPSSWDGWTTSIARLQTISLSGTRRNFAARGLKQALSILLDYTDSSSPRNPVSRIFLASHSADFTSTLPASERASHRDILVRLCKQAADASIVVYTFGIGDEHDPYDLVKVSNHTRGLYTFVSDWAKLPKSIAGCLGLCMSMSHRDVRITVTVPASFGGRILKIEGCLLYSIADNGREAEICIGDTAFGDLRDLIVQVSIPPEDSINKSPPREQWDVIVSDIHSIGYGSGESESCGSRSDNELEIDRSSPRRSSYSYSPSLCRSRKQGSTSSASSVGSSVSSKSSLMRCRRRPAVESFILDGDNKELILEAEISFLQFSASHRRHKVKRAARLQIPIFSVPDPEPLRRRKRNKPAPLSPQLVSPLTSNPGLSQRRIELLTAECLLQAIELVNHDKPEQATFVLSRARKIIQGLSRGALPSPPSTSPLTSAFSSEVYCDYWRSQRSSLSAHSIIESTTGSHSALVDSAVAEVLDMELGYVIDRLYDGDAAFINNRVPMVVDILVHQRACTVGSRLEQVYSRNIDAICSLSAMVAT
ncbi:uncharacterized protein V2V93DRAFT_370557 [Kockiozyma suomiensis]|uniref:uncharacterized protein n=1 Tax=Kockiozyma suomiensis TaxID=1337062 RepID=UPI0033441F73